jgi:hypothetical protein
VLGDMVARESPNEPTLAAQALVANLVAELRL